MVSEKGLRRFRQLYKEHFGVMLSEKEATEKAQRLVTLFKVVYKQMASQNNREGQITDID